MKPLARLAQRIQSVEMIAPRRWRLPLRYHGQRLVGGLEPEMALLPELARSEGIALDIGANRGIYAYAIARLGVAVRCFEPLSEFCRYIEDFSSPLIQAHNVALSDQAGELELHVPIIGGHRVYTRASLDRPDAPFETRRVPVRTLDSYELAGVGFIKIDVEGAEAAVLRGAARTLSEGHPTLLVEIDRTRHSRESLLAVHADLNRFGYEAHVCEHGELVACRDAWAASAHHVNFIFS